MVNAHKIARINELLCQPPIESLLVRWKRVSFHCSLWQVLDVAIFNLIFSLEMLLSFHIDVLLLDPWAATWPHLRSLYFYLQFYLSYISQLNSMDFLIALSLNLTISSKTWAKVMQLCHSRSRLTAETVGKEGRLCCFFSCSPLKHPYGLYFCSFNTVEGPGSKTGNVCCVALIFNSVILH